MIIHQKSIDLEIEKRAKRIEQLEKELINDKIDLLLKEEAISSKEDLLETLRNEKILFNQIISNFELKQISKFLQVLKYMKYKHQQQLKQSYKDIIQLLLEEND